MKSAARTPPTRAKAPSRGRLPRSLLASASVHVALLGTGILLGVFDLGGTRGAPRSYSARFEAPSVLDLPETPIEPLEPSEPVDRSEPELRESEVWAEALVADFLPEPVPAPEPTAIDWSGESLRPPFSLASLPPSEAPARDEVPVVSEVPANTHLADVPLAPIIADPVPLEVPSPPYPRLARRAGEQGSVLLRLELDREGRVARVEVVESSGFSRLDRAAQETLSGWRFEPRREDGRAVASSVLHRVTFRLGAS